MTEQDSKKVKKASDFLCKVRYKNTLPDIPFDPKTLDYEVDVSKYTSFVHTSMIKKHQWDYYPDTSVVLDLVDMEAWNPDAALELDPDDVKLLRDSSEANSSTRTPKPSVSWLRRTEYISGEYSKVIAGKENVESKMGLNVQLNDDEYRTREDHIRGIEESFEAAKRVCQHPTKPHLTAVKTIPVFPDKQLWANQYSLCAFDDDPTAIKETILLESVNQALMKPMKNTEDVEDRFVLFFLPTEATLKKRKLDSTRSERHGDPDVYEYVKDFSMQLKVEQTKHQYFFVQRTDGIYYNELNSKLTLHKRRTKPKAAKDLTQDKSSLLYITPRDPISEEIETQQDRLKELS